MDDRWILDALEVGVSDDELRPGFEDDLRQHLRAAWRSQRPRRLTGRTAWLVAAACVFLVVGAVVGISLLRGTSGPATRLTPATPPPTGVEVPTTFTSVPDTTETTAVASTSPPTIERAAQPWTVTPDAVRRLLPSLQPTFTAGEAEVELDVDGRDRASVTATPSADGDAASATVCLNIIDDQAGLSPQCGELRYADGLRSVQSQDNDGNTRNYYVTAADVTIDSADCTTATATGPSIRLTVCTPLPDRSNVQLTSTGPDGRRYRWTDPVIAADGTLPTLPVLPRDRATQCEAQPPDRPADPAYPPANPIAAASTDALGRISLRLTDDNGTISTTCIEPYVWQNRDTTGYVVGTPYAAGHLITVVTTRPLPASAAPPWTPLHTTSSDNLNTVTYYVPADQPLDPLVSPLHAELVGHLRSLIARPPTAPHGFQGPVLDVR